MNSTCNQKNCNCGKEHVYSDGISEIAKTNINKSFEVFEQKKEELKTEVEIIEKKRDFCSFHSHSSFSLLDGAAHIDDYIKSAKEFGHKSMALTDHGHMSGTFEFYNKCKAAGIKPIIGMESYLNDSLDYRGTKGEEKSSEGKDTHQSIIIKNKEGFINANKLTYLSFTEGYYRRGRITTDWLIANKQGLLITTSCMASRMARLIEEGKEQEAEERIKLLMREFGDDLIAELQFNEIPQQKKYNHFILRMIKKYSIMPILAGDIHYNLPSDNRLQDVLIAINQHKSIYDPSAFKLQARHLFYSDRDNFYKMNKEFGYNYPDKFIEECLDNTLKVAEKCNFEFETDVEKFPKYEPTPDVVEYFKETGTKEIITKLAHAKLKQKLNVYKKNGLVKIDDEVIQRYKDRLDYELKVIDDKKMLDYFMVIWELIKFCQKEGIATGVGRGCFVPGSRVKMSDGLYSPIEIIDIGEEIIDAYGNKQIVINTLTYDIEEDIIELEFKNKIKIKCTLDHEFLTSNRGWVKADELSEDDEIIEI